MEYLLVGCWSLDSALGIWNPTASGDSLAAARNQGLPPAGKALIPGVGSLKVTPWALGRTGPPGGWVWVYTQGRTDGPWFNKKSDGHSFL